MTMNHNQIAAAIIVGSLLVATTVLFKFSSPTSEASNITYARSANALIYGNENASVKIVEFSDFECPFCGRLHPTLKRVIDESAGEVAWEYRHLPLGNHRNALYAAVISECVAEVKGVSKFWEFSDELFTQSNTLSTEKINLIASNFGLQQSQIEDCENNDDLKARITNDIEVANSAGARGTPYSLITTKDKPPKVVSGALPYEHWVSQINNLKNE